MFFFSQHSRTFIFSGATKCYPPPWNFLSRKNNCMCNWDNARDVAACPDEQSTKRMEPNKPSTNQDKHHERSSNVCYTLNSWEHMPLNIKSNEIFKKIIFGWNIFQQQLIAEAGICRSFFWNPSWKFHKFPRRTFPVSVR